MNHLCTHPRRAARRAQATVRATARAQRSDAEQLALLDTRPGVSARERTRLLAHLEQPQA